MTVRILLVCMGYITIAASLAFIFWEPVRLAFRRKA